MNELHALDSPPIDSLVVSKQYVTEEEYWEKYYDDPNVIYEWNQGYLEEKGVSDTLTFWVYQWLSQLLNYYLQTQAIAKTTGPEIGFRIALSPWVEIRRPDLGVVLDTNPVVLLPTDKTFQGIYDLCIEAISDTSRQDIERDSIDKKHCYAQAGVKEYYILDGHDRYTAFYYLSQQGVYLPIQPVDGDIIQSTVLPGFQFRRADLLTRPTIEKMVEDPVYPFVFPAFQQEKQARIAAQALAEKEKQARIAAEAQVQQLLEKLRASGIDPEKSD